MTVIHRFIYQHTCQDGTWRLHDSIRTGVSHEAQIQGAVVIPIDQPAAAQPAFGGLGTIQYKCRFIESEGPATSTTGTPARGSNTPCATISCAECVLYIMCPCLLLCKLVEDIVLSDGYNNASRPRHHHHHHTGAARRRRARRRKQRRRRRRRGKKKK